MVLDYLHAKGIIYRDVKMENILLDENGNIKIIDFGLSKWLSLGQRTTTICGTLQCKLKKLKYIILILFIDLDIAPEVLSVRPYDHRVDWWSLGILMYACLFGEYPVSATKDHVTMANKVLNHTFNLPSIAFENKIQVKELLLHLLEKNPNQRLCSLDELRQTSFMSKLDFNRVYSKYYSPLNILMNIKSEWRNELQLHYNHQQNGKDSSSSPRQTTVYQNINNHGFQKFSE
jgi:serine/threonine protein kinase